MSSTNSESELWQLFRETWSVPQVIPSKLFECMGMGIPVLHGVAGESAELVERKGAGLCLSPSTRWPSATACCV